VSVDRDARAVLVRLTGEGGYPAPPRIVLSFHHATRGGVDVAIDLEAGAEEGVYTGAWRELESGMWNVSLATAEWRLVGRHQVLPGATGDGARLVVTPAPH